MGLRKLASPSTLAGVVLTLLPLAVQGQPLHGLLAPVPPASSGALLGQIRNAKGVTQMGATVLLFDRFDHPVGRALSTAEGRFAFAGLPPGIYNISVTLASFFPAMRRNITILAGSENLLQVSLAAVLSSIDLVPGGPNRATLMSDDFKWVLRASQSTRPVLRFLPYDDPAPESATYAGTTGVIRLSGGDSNTLNNALLQDMGTAFAVETPFSANTKVRVSGSLGYGAASGLPSASFRTTYARERQGLPGPQIALTVRQAYYPAMIAAQNAPMLRTASLSSIDSVDLLDALHLEYGFSLDSITLYGRMNYVSPFARATYALGQGGEMKVAYSAGFAPAELLARTAQSDTQTADAGLREDLTALAQGPRISRRDDQATVERGKNYEASYEIVDGRRTYSAMAFREDISNAVFLMSGDTGLAGVANLLPDLNTRGTVYNVGNYQRTGVQLAFTQFVDELLEITFAAGRAEALVSDGSGDTGGSLRGHIRHSPRPWATLRLNTSVPRAGTRFSTSYGWTDYRALMPVHQSLTGRTYQELGWNIRTNQPLPQMLGVRMELVAELHNLLAQGYLTLQNTDGRKAVLTNTPRQVSGGLSIIF